MHKSYYETDILRQHERMKLNVKKKTQNLGPIFFWHGDFLKNESRLKGLFGYLHITDFVVDYIP